MEEDSTGRETRSLVQTDEKRQYSHTASPPSFSIRQRTSSTDATHNQKKNYHERNMVHIKTLKEKNSVRKTQLEEEKKNLEQTRERLAKIILKRSEALKKAKEEVLKKSKEEEDKKSEFVIKEQPEEEYYKKKTVSAYYRSRYASLLKTIQETNKSKVQMKEIEEQKKEKFKKKLKEEMGLGNVTSKLLNPTVSSLVNSNVATENDIVELKGQKYAACLQNLPKNGKKNQNKPPEDEKEKQKIGREAAEKIKKRALDHLVHLADKKGQDAKREEEAKRKEEKLKASLRETVLSKAKTVEIPKEEGKEDSESSDEPETVTKRVKKSDDGALKRLSQAPKRWNTHTITDIAQFRKKYKLSEKDKIFIVMGGYPDMRRALLSRSTSYIGRLVRES